MSTAVPSAFRPLSPLQGVAPPTAHVVRFVELPNDPRTREFPSPKRNRPLAKRQQSLSSNTDEIHGDLTSFFSMDDDSDEFTEDPFKLVKLPANFVKICAKSFDRRLDLWSELFAFLLFFLLFLFFVAVDSDVNDLYFNGMACKSPATTPIPPEDFIVGPTYGMTFLTMRQVTDVHGWLERLVIPAYWGSSTTSSVPVDHNLRIVLGNQIPVGALTIRLVVRPDEYPSPTCWNVTSLDPSSPTLCSLSLSKEIIDSTPREENFGPLKYRTKYDSVMSYTYALTRVRYSWSGNELRIPFSASMSEALTAARTLRKNATAGWYGLSYPGIEMVSVVATTYNPALGYYARTEFLLEARSIGVVVPSTHYWPTKPSNENAAYTVIFFIVMLVAVAMWIRRLFARRRLVAPLTTVWTYFEMICHCSLFVFFVLRFKWWTVIDQARSKVILGQTMASEADLASITDTLEYVAALKHFERQVASWCTIMFFLKLLKFTSISRSMEQVTSAMRRAQENIIGLLIIFVACVLAFAVSGNALFGGQMHEFHDITTSFGSVMRTLIGDSNYAGMRQVNPLLAGIYYWALLIFGLFITLNFIMAVIAEALENELDEIDFIVADDAHVNIKQQYFAFVQGLRRNVMLSWNALVNSFVEAKEAGLKAYEAVVVEANATADSHAPLSDSTTQTTSGTHRFQECRLIVKAMFTSCAWFLKRQFAFYSIVFKDTLFTYLSISNGSYGSGELTGSNRFEVIYDVLRDICDEPSRKAAKTSEDADDAEGSLTEEMERRVKQVRYRHMEINLHIFKKRVFEYRKVMRERDETQTKASTLRSLIRGFFDRNATATAADARGRASAAKDEALASFLEEFWVETVQLYLSWYTSEQERAKEDQRTVAIVAATDSVQKHLDRFSKLPMADIAQATTTVAQKLDDMAYELLSVRSAIASLKSS